MIRLVNENEADVYTLNIQDAQDGTTESATTNCLIAAYHMRDENGVMVTLNFNCDGDTIVAVIDALHKKLDSYLRENEVLREQLHIKRHMPRLYDTILQLLRLMEGNDEQDD